MTAISSESLLADLRHLPLLAPEHLARVETAVGKGASTPEKIVRRLVDKGWITPFQGEVLLGGKAAGLVFGPYVLLSRLGEGGMGAVFKARHVRLGRIDALKVIRADKSSSKLVAKRFQREIQLTADLNHPHLIKALDAGKVGNQLYLATEYIPGEDLTSTVRRDGPFSVADACLVVYQTALALRHIHERGLIHRDLKPSNIMREEKSRAVKLLDLGLSSSLNELQFTGSIAGNLTRDGVMLGTPDYMAPEQARDPHGVDIRADLYGLGCTFFYLLTGRTPFEGSPVDKLMQHASAPPPVLVLPHGPTPAALADIIARLMAKRPDDRYQTPQALIDAMLALRPGQAPISLPENATEPTHEWQSQFDLLVSQDASASGMAPLPTAAPRKSSVPWVVAAVAMLLVVPLVIYAAIRGRTTVETANPASEQTVEEPVDELKALRKAVAGTGENRDQLRTRVLEFRARQTAMSNAVAAAALLRKLPSPLDRLAPGAPAMRLTEPGGSVAWLRFTPNDERLLISRRGELAEAWELPALKSKGSLGVGKAASDGVASASPDGRVVIVPDSDGRILVWSEGGRRNPHHVDVGPGLVVSTCAVSPDGKFSVVACADTENRLARVSLETGKILGRLDHPSKGVSELTYSPDGAVCLAFGPENMNRVLSASTGKLLQVLDTPSPTGGFGADGQRLYLIGAFRTAARFPPGTATPDVQFEVGPDLPNPFAPRGTGGRPTCIAASADDTAVAVGTRSGRLYIYSAANGKLTQELRLASAIRAATFSTHGRVLAVALDDGSVMLVPLKS